MSNGLADRFKRGDESVMDMMKRIKEEITTEATANQWENKLEEFGVIFQSVTWQSRRKMYSNPSIYWTSKSVTTDSDAFFHL